MDNRIANDMISSGMIPSGEKKKEDLSRTQYGSAPSPSKLMDAYKKMYEVSEEGLPIMRKQDLGKPFGAGGAVPAGETPKVGKVTTYKKDPKTGKLNKSKPQTDKKGEEKQKDFAQGSYSIYGDKKTGYGETRYESLVAAYNAVYEHHKKDADGNTIPHEGEELKEENINELKTRTMLNYIDKASDSASKQLDKANKTTSRKKEVKARLKMDSRERGIEMAKDKIMKRVKTEEVDKFDIVFNHFISEGYSEKEAYTKMANLTEEQLDEFLQALAPLAKGMMAGAVKLGAKAKPIATNLAKQGKALGKVDTIAKAKPKVSPGQMSLDLKGAGMKSTPQKSFSASSPSQVVDPKENLRSRTGGNQFGDEIKRQATQMAINKAMSGGGGGQKERAKNISASADLFDIVKGQLLDEGLSEEEIKDIMLTLTPDEILNELSGDLLKRAAIKAGDERGKLASQGDREGAMKKMDQQKKFSDAMKSKNLEKSRAENMRKPTQYDRPVSRPTPDPTKPYPGTPR